MRPWFGVTPPPRDWWESEPWTSGSHYFYSKTVTTNNNTPPPAPPVDETRVRKIVREEMADIMPIDVPDAPPEDL